jgi:N-terminal acetyltransferase B complex catalytic subunit
MTSIRQFKLTDLFRINNINLDIFTENYGLSFYLHYLTRWPECFFIAENPAQRLMGYIMGKIEGKPENYHGHVTALTVAPEFRRIGVSSQLMALLENVSEQKKTFFVDLFVRVSNKRAVDMYHKLNYIIYRRILGYYSGERDEDAFDMRKALSRDVNKKFLVPIPYPVRPEDLVDD